MLRHETSEEQNNRIGLESGEAQSSKPTPSHASSATDVICKPPLREAFQDLPLVPSHIAVGAVLPLARSKRLEIDTTRLHLDERLLQAAKKHKASEAFKKHTSVVAKVLAGTVSASIAAICACLTKYPVLTFTAIFIALTTVVSRWFYSMLYAVAPDLITASGDYRRCVACLELLERASDEERSLLLWNFRDALTTLFRTTDNELKPLDTASIRIVGTEGSECSLQTLLATERLNGAQYDFKNQFEFKNRVALDVKRPLDFRLVPALMDLIALGEEGGAFSATRLLNALASHLAEKRMLHPSVLTDSENGTRTYNKKVNYLPMLSQAAELLSFAVWLDNAPVLTEEKKREADRHIAQQAAGFITIFETAEFRKTFAHRSRLKPLPPTSPSEILVRSSSGQTPPEELLRALKPPLDRS